MWGSRTGGSGSARFRCRPAGDHTTFDRNIRRGDFGIAVIVYEKMAQLLIQSPGILVDCSLIVVDEIQMIADRTRGPSLEILLTHIRQLDSRRLLACLQPCLTLAVLIRGSTRMSLTSGAGLCPLWEGIAFPIGASELENVETTESQPGPDLTAIAVPHSTWLPGSKLDITYRILLAEGLSNKPSSSGPEWTIPPPPPETWHMSCQPSR